MTTDTTLAVLDTSKTKGMGILQPALQYRFRILFDDPRQNDSYEVFTQQVMDYKLDALHNKLTINLRQITLPGMFNLINTYIRHEHDIFLEILDGSNVIIHNTVRLTRCKCINHNIDFNYASNQCSAHTLEFVYKNLKETSGIEWENK